MPPNTEERVWPQPTVRTPDAGSSQRKRKEGRTVLPPYGAVGISFLLLMMLLAACDGLRSSSTEEDDSTAASEAIPHYEIEFTLSEDLIFLQGSAHIRVPNTSADPWTHLVFRLYPALDHYGGDFSIQNVTVEGSTAPFIYLDQNTAIRVDLPRALLRGQTTTVYVSWLLRIPHWSADTSGAYRLFGYSQDFVSLPLFYPSLAVYQPGPTAATGRWWLERGTSRGDAAFNYMSSFVVSGTVPIDMIPVTSGQLITSTVVDEGQIRHRWETEPSREFIVHMSDRFQSDSLSAYGTLVTSYWLPGHEEAGRAVLQHTAASLRVYSDWFGPYPYEELRVASAPISFRGMEYPQVFLLGVQLYDRYRDQLEIRAVHEVAHQWWYQLVHNDPVNEPWVDEGLAEYSSRIYYEAVHGPDAADILEYRRWEAVVDGLISREEDAALAQPVTAFADGVQYEGIVYGKGALFFSALRRTLGEREFKQFLQGYLANNQYKIVTSLDMLEALRQVNPQVADLLYTEWIGPIVSQPPEVTAPETE
ncbi:MAG: M1 family metallopeptidase [Caldilineaceae bacterium]|nr:M1 family metallopeptidase [Caldilineaceae bacterium]